MIAKTEPWYEATLGLVKQRHGGKQDKVGRPYYQHFERVTDRLLRSVPDATRAQVQAALLHDALEPGEMSVADLWRVGIDDEVIGLIQAITLPTDDRSYMQYIADLAGTRNIAAIQVKLADNADAVANHQADGSPNSKQTLEQTYLPARQMLLQALSGPEIEPAADWPAPVREEFRGRLWNGHVGTRLLAETEEVRVWESRLRPGERIGFHRHVLSYCWTAMCVGTSHSHHENGTIRERSYKPGDTAYYEYGLGEFRYHDLENVGETELLFAIVERLDSPNPPLDLRAFVSASA